MMKLLRAKQLPFACALLILLLAAALRLHNLGAQSLWNDEGSSYVQSLRGVGEIADNAARDIHPPGYYWALAGWRLGAGTSEFALRALSAFASLLSVAFAYALGKRLFGTAAALTAALIVALNTFSIYYAQEARMYAPLALWSAASLWALAGFLRQPSGRWAMALALFNAAGLWTQYAYPFVMLAQGVVALVWIAANLSRGRFNLRAIGLYVGANLLTIALYLPWLPTALRQLTTWPNTGDSTPLPNALATTLNWLTFGSTTPPAELAIPALLLLFGMLVFSRRDLWRVVLPVASVVVPVVLFLALGLFRLDNLKLLLPAQIGMALWIGRGVGVLWTLKLKYGRRRDYAARLTQAVPPITALLCIVWFVVVLGEGIAPLYGDPAYQRADYRSIARTIEASATADDAVILDAPNQEEVFRYYYTGAAPIYPLPAGLGGDDEATRASVEQIIAEHRRAYVVFWGETERDPQRVVESTLDAGAYELGDQWYGDVRLAQYALSFDPEHPTVGIDSNTRFGDHIRLLGYHWNASYGLIGTGDVLKISLDWRTDAPLDKRYKVFVQLLDADGMLVAQRDSEPGGGLALTTTWTPEKTVVDRHALLLDVPPGEYSLIAGLYDMDDPTARLPVDTGGDAFTLTTITVVGD